MNHMPNLYKTNEVELPPPLEDSPTFQESPRRQAPKSSLTPNMVKQNLITDEIMKNYISVKEAEEKRNESPKRGLSNDPMVDNAAALKDTNIKIRQAME
jgi:hypothetical protein